MHLKNHYKKIRLFSEPRSLNISSVKSHENLTLAPLQSQNYTSKQRQKYTYIKEVPLKLFRMPIPKNQRLVKLKLNL